MTTTRAQTRAEIQAKIVELRRKQRHDALLALEPEPA